MEKLNQWIVQIAVVVNELTEGIEGGRIGLKDVEEELVQRLNDLGSMLVEEIVERVQEPVTENRVLVDGEVAVYDQMRNLRFINRFGGLTIRLRRCYKYLKKAGGYYPLDEKLGLDVCKGFSPLLTYLQAFFGATEPWESSAQLLTAALGFGVSATAVQSNTEMVGSLMPEDPCKIIGTEKQKEGSELMLVEIDGTMTPQIIEVEGVSGRESLKHKTEYKECNVVVIEKYRDGECIDRWIGAKYGPRKGFEEYVRRAGLQMGQLGAQQVAFVADGAHSNWEIQTTNFPGAIGILDFYHASEHLAKLCELYENPQKADSQYKRWKQMMREGEVLQMIAEQKQALPELKDHDKAVGEINYFTNNCERMHYDEYKDASLPLGSGLVEGACKFVIGKRFKGSGMRWKKLDNEKTLRVRLAKLNGILLEFFKPSPKPWMIVDRYLATAA
jgi:hypothetical protein